MLAVQLLYSGDFSFPPRCNLGHPQVLGLPNSFTFRSCCWVSSFWLTYSCSGPSEVSFLDCCLNAAWGVRYQPSGVGKYFLFHRVGVFGELYKQHCTMRSSTYAAGIR